MFSPGGVTRSASTTARTTGLVLGVLARRHRLRHRDAWSRERLLDYQARELARLRRYAYTRSPFYRRFHAGGVDGPLSTLPVLTKSLLMENFDELVTAQDVRLDAVEEYLAGLRGERPPSPRRAPSRRTYGSARSPPSPGPPSARRRSSRRPMWSARELSAPWSITPRGFKVHPMGVYR